LRGHRAGGAGCRRSTGDDDSHSSPSGQRPHSGAATETQAEEEGRARDQLAESDHLAGAAGAAHRGRPQQRPHARHDPDHAGDQLPQRGADGRILAFPSENTQWSIVGGAEQRVESNLDLEYQTGLLRDSPFSLTVESLYDRSGTPRFYGIGNNSYQINQTVYIDQQLGAYATLGWNITHAWQLAYTFAAKKVKVLGTTLPGIPPITSRFEGTFGIGTTHELLNRIALVYDTRNDIVIPSSGMEVVAYGGAASRDFDLDSSLFTEAGGDGKFYWSPYPSLVVATHVDLRYEPTTHRVPFWALSSLGGDESDIGGSQTLRGYGTSRFYDRDSFSANLELRQNVYSMDAFSTHIDIQVAPFFDTGRVFGSSSTFPITHLHNVLGVGFRGIAPPSVVGYVDIGKGHEGLAVFTGIGYPF